MANQITIDIGAAANDGTGDPLRTAFNYVNNNFSNVWNTGLPNSNVQFSDNRILTVNSNANLVLAPNGIGKVASNVDIVPNTANVFALGGSTRRWNTIYGQYLDLSHNATIGGNLTVTGNLSAGNISYTSNVFVGDLEGSVFDGASSIVLDVIDSSIYIDNYYYANGTPVTFGGGGTPGGANTQVQYNNAGSFGGSASFTFDRTSNVLAVSGNITAGNILVSNLTTTDEIYAATGSLAGDPNTGDGALYVGSPSFTSLGTDVMAQFTGNVTNYGQINFQNYSNSPTASGDYIATADNGNDTTHYIDMGITSSTWNGTQTNVLTGLAPNNGYLYVQDGNLTLGTRNSNTSYSWNFDTTGNLTVPGNIIPTANNTQSLGSPTQQWADLYVSNATIFMNNVPLSLNSSNVLTVNGADVVTTAANGESSIGNLDILGTTVSIAAGSPETYLDLSASVQGFAYVQVPNDATANVSNVRIHNDAGNIEFGTDAGNNLWYFSNAGTLTVPGPITSAVDTEITATDDVVIYGGDKAAGGGEGGDVFIDGGNGADDNGTSVSGGGDIELTGGVGGDALDTGSGSGGFVRLVGGDGGTANSGNSIQAGEGGQIVILGGSAGDNNGNLSLNGLGGNVEIYGGSGSFDVANSRPDGPAGHVNLYGGNWGFNFVPTGNIYLNTYDGTNFKTLTYDNHGNVTMASGGALNFVGSNPGIVSGLNEDFYIRASDDEADGWSIYNVVDDGAGNILSQTRLEFDQYTIRTDGQGAGYTWAFRDTGVLELPGDIYGNVGDNLTIKIGDQAGSDTFIDLQTRSYVGDALISNIRIANPNVTISTSNAAYNWIFGGTGITTFPDNTLAANDDFVIQVTNGVPTSTANINSQGGYNIGSYTGLSTTGGSGTGLTVNASTAGNGYIDTVTINAPGSGYTNGDTITIVGGDGLGCTFTIGVPTPAWTFSTDGNFSLNGSNITGGIATVVDDGINSIAQAAGAQMDVFGFPFSGGGVRGQLTISGVTTPNEVNGTWYYQSLNTYIYQIYTDSTYSTLVDATGWSAYTGGGTVAITKQNPAANIVINSNGYFSKFDNTGDLTLPGDLLMANNASITTTNAAGNVVGKSINIRAGAADQGDYYTTAGGNLNLIGGLGAGNDGGGGGPGGDVNITSGLSADVAGHAGNVTINAGSNTWKFDYNGVATLPGEGILRSIDDTITLTSLNTSTGNANSVYLGSSGGLGFSDQEAGGNWLEIFRNGAEPQITVPVGRGNLYIQTSQGGTPYNWTFDNTGNLTLPGNISGNTAGYAIGYRDIPQVSFTGNATIATTDAGKHFYSTQSSNYILTIANNASQGFQVGSAITVVNQGTGTITVAQGSGVTLYIAGNATSGNRSISTFGMATIMKVATNTWFINGTGVS